MPQETPRVGARCRYSEVPPGHGWAGSAFPMRQFVKQSYGGGLNDVRVAPLDHAGDPLLKPVKPGDVVIYLGPVEFTAHQEREAT